MESKNPVKNTSKKKRSSVAESECNCVQLAPIPDSTDTSKQGSQKKGAPKQDTTKQGTPQKNIPKQNKPNQAPPKKVTPKKGTPKQDTPKQATPKQNTPKQNTPKNASQKKQAGVKETNKSNQPKDVKKPAPPKSKLEGFKKPLIKVFLESKPVINAVN